MNISLVLVLIIYFAKRFHCVGLLNDELCASPQYLEIDKMGTIHCEFEEDYFGVFWYDTTDYSNSDPMLHTRNLIKTGPGYTSGEFDVHPNGSLIINKVSLRHERNFTVAYVHSASKEPVFITVEILIVVYPSIPFPMFNYCGNLSNECFAEVGENPVQCQVVNARPKVILQVVVRILDEDKIIANDTSFKLTEIGYTSRVTTTDIFQYSPLLVLLICKSISASWMLESNESLILAQNNNVDLPFAKKQLKYFERNTRMHLDCTESDIRFIVWKKIDASTKISQEVLLYSILTDKGLTETSSGDLRRANNSSLTISVVDIKHEGLYYCIYGNGLTNGEMLYEVVVYVLPVPEYPVVDGCDHRHYCVLNVELEGTLSCKVKGIRPKIHLEWKTFYDIDTTAISFTKQQLTVSDNGYTFDVTLTSSYRIEDALRGRLTVECRAEESHVNIFQLTQKVDLIFLKGNFVETIEPKTLTRVNNIKWTIAVILLLLLLIFGGMIITKWRNRRKIKKKVSTVLPEEEVLLQSLTGKKKLFLKELKITYKDLYEAVQPIPYIKDRLYCVDNVFVETGVVCLHSKGLMESWEHQTLDTYQKILSDPLVRSKRIILEGEPGYGKSTITLQFAYDWCNSKSTSPLKDVEILIVLRLRQLEGVQSIYKAIRKFVLPKDSTISEEDIENILQSCHSVVLILDGFDEYPDRDSVTVTDVMTIISRQMFRQFNVITTTRTSFLPKKYAPSTIRIRLTGFNDNARRAYIQKAIVAKGGKHGDEIEKYLRENPVLYDLCQVPLLFVILAHMTNESRQFRNLNSVTSFFRYMISCFHSHMKNKSEEENVCKVEISQHKHENLDRAAFEALSGRSQKLVWEKEELSQEIGNDLYDQYLRIGILVEEKVNDSMKIPSNLITEHVQYRKEVRFHHKLFCEWFAAHYVSNHLQHPDVDTEQFLKHLDPVDAQYVYRFVCGLNPTAAEKIIKYLANIEGGEKFSILCIAEQTENVDQVIEPISRLCEEGIIISGYDSLLLQRASMELLEIAARNKIPIRAVSLFNCFGSVELSPPAIRTTSNFILTPGISFQRLGIHISDRVMTEDEATAILQFSSKCPSLEVLLYDGCVPPRSFRVDSTLLKLQENSVKVRWIWYDYAPPYHLNLQSGTWEKEEDGSQPTVESFKKMLSKDAEDRKTWTEETYKGWVDEGRKGLRKKAEKRRRDK